MKHKQLKLIALLLLGLGLSNLQAQSLYVNNSNGVQNKCLLINVKKITFSPDNLSVHKTDNSTTNYALSGLNFLSFDDYTDINEFENESQKQISVYPNPVIDVLNLDLSNIAQQSNISILNLDGKMIKTQKVDGKKNTSINLSHLPAGIYLCRYSNQTEIKTVKIIKQ